MSDVELGINYWLAQTQFTVTLARRNVMETGTFGSYARPVVDIVIAPSAVADPMSRQSLAVDSGLLTKLSLNNGADRIALCVGPCADGLTLDMAIERLKLENFGLTLEGSAPERRPDPRLGES